MIVITGGSGYIGSWIAKRLVNSFNVRLIDVKPPSLQIPGVEYVQCDIRDINQVRNAINGAQLVIHTAIIQIPAINEHKRLGYEVNVIGTQNVCRAVEQSRGTKGMILASSWHVIGEHELRGLVDETFGFRVDKVEDRARLYALCKVCQESIVRLFEEFSEKRYGILRMGTVLGEGMPGKTAANIFITKAVRAEPLTVFKHSMYRPMLYVDILDVCLAYERFAKILLERSKGGKNSLDSVVGVYYPSPITVLELAEAVRDEVISQTGERIKPEVEIIDTGLPALYESNDMNLFKADVGKAMNMLGIERLTPPKETVGRLVRSALEKQLVWMRAKIYQTKKRGFCSS